MARDRSSGAGRGGSSDNSNRGGRGRGRGAAAAAPPAPAAADAQVPPPAAPEEQPVDTSGLPLSWFWHRSFAFPLGSDPETLLRDGVAETVASGIQIPPVQREEFRQVFLHNVSRAQWVAQFGPDTPYPTAPPGSAPPGAPGSAVAARDASDGAGLGQDPPPLALVEAAQPAGEMAAARAEAEAARAEAQNAEAEQAASTSVAELTQRLQRMCGEGAALAAQPLDALQSLERTVEGALKNIRDAIVEARVSAERAQAVESSRQAAEAANECTVCMGNPRDTLLGPCGHIYCRECSERVQQCPPVPRGD